MVKYMMGLPFVIFIVLLIWCPLLAFSLLNKVGQVRSLIFGVWSIVHLYYLGSWNFGGKLAVFSCFAIGLNGETNLFDNVWWSCFSEIINTICRRFHPSKWRWRWPSRDIPWVWCFTYFNLFNQFFQTPFDPFLAVFGIFWLAINNSSQLQPLYSITAQGRELMTMTDDDYKKLKERYSVVRLEHSSGRY